jgi:hypothetical protein
MARSYPVLVRQDQKSPSDCDADYPRRRKMPKNFVQIDDSDPRDVAGDTSDDPVPCAAE